MRTISLLQAGSSGERCGFSSKALPDPSAVLMWTLLVQTVPEPSIDEPHADAYLYESDGSLIAHRRMPVGLFEHLQRLLTSPAFLSSSGQLADESIAFIEAALFRVQHGRTWLH